MTNQSTGRTTYSVSPEAVSGFQEVSCVKHGYHYKFITNFCFLAWCVDGFNIQHVIVTMCMYAKVQEQI